MQGDNAKEVFQSLSKQPEADFTSPIWDTMPTGAVDLLMRLLEKDPAVRITAADVLRHPWMMSHAAKAVVPSHPGSIPRNWSFSDSAQSHTSERLILLDQTISEGGGDDDCSLSPGGSAGPSITSRQATGGSVSARIFCPPENLKMRILMHGFIDLYKKHVEAPYTLLLKAPNADTAAVRWGAFCFGLKELNTYLEANASRTGPLFWGDEPCMVEAAIAPALFRMIAVLVRGACVFCPVR